MPEIRSNKYGKGREALLEATVVVVGQRGLHGLTFRAVAEIAKVNNTLVSYHFGNKDALLREAVSWAVARAIRLSDFSEIELFDSDFASTLVEFVDREPNLHLFQYEFILESRRRPELRDEASALYEAYISALENVLLQHGHIDCRPLARTVFAALDGLVFQQLTIGDSEAVKEAIDCIEHILQGRLLLASQSQKKREEATE